MLPSNHRPIPTAPRIYLALTLSACLLFSACSQSTEEGSRSTEEQIEQSVAALQIFDFKQAYTTLSELQPTLDPSSEHWALATYSYGLAAWFKTPTTKPDINLAISLFEEIVKRQPQSEFAASALLDLGRIAEVSDYIDDPTDVPTAQAYYERVRQQFPQSAMSTRAALFLAQSYAQSLEPSEIQKAITILEASIAEQSTDEWLGVLGQYTGQLYETYLDDASKAIEPYLLAVDAGLPRVATRDAALWKLGVLAEAIDRQQIAIQIYKRIVSDFPRTTFRTVAEERLSHLANHSPADDRQP